MFLVKIKEKNHITISCCNCNNHHDMFRVVIILNKGENMIVKTIIVCVIWTTVLVAMEDPRDNTTINSKENYLVEIISNLERLSRNIKSGEMKGDDYWLTMMKSVGKIECCLELGIPQFENERKEISTKLKDMEAVIRAYFASDPKPRQEQGFCGFM